MKHFFIVLLCGFLSFTLHARKEQFFFRVSSDLHERIDFMVLPPSVAEVKSLDMKEMETASLTKILELPARKHVDVTLPTPEVNLVFFIGENKQKLLCGPVKSFHKVTVRHKKRNFCVIGYDQSFKSHISERKSGHLRRHRH